MNELVLLSGKGGTGKTTVTAALAHQWAGRAVFVDADVDAANLHLVTRPETTGYGPFIGGKLARVDADRCTGCGTCTDLCRFGAIDRGRVDRFGCEGCGLCAMACPERAIRLDDRQSGQWYSGRSPYGPVLHARLHPGEGNSGKLVSLLREEARGLARAQGVGRIVVDGPPGVGCPVMACLAGASAVLAVAEPSASGLHDLERVLQLGRHFELPCAVAVNRADVAPALTRQVIAAAGRFGAPVLAEIPYDPAVPACVADARPVTERPDSPAAEALRDLAGAAEAFLSAP